MDSNGHASGLPDDVVCERCAITAQGAGAATSVSHLSFAEAELRRLFGIVVSTRQIKRCLAQVDPEGRRVRAKEAARLRYQYNVPGPRSLYHADAHEKLAKIWGIWLHLCIDGYSRFIIYLVAQQTNVPTPSRQFSWRDVTNSAGHREYAGIRAPRIRVQSVLR